jgi:hypothetical protein
LFRNALCRCEIQQQRDVDSGSSWLSICSRGSQIRYGSRKLQVLKMSTVTCPQSTTTARKMSRSSKGRERPTHIENLGNATSTSPTPEWRPEQAPVRQNKNSPNGTQQPGDTASRIHNGPCPAKRKSCPESSRSAPPAERRKLDERGIVNRRLSIPLTAAASGIPQVKLLLPTPPSTPITPTQNTLPKRDRSRLHPKWRSRAERETSYSASSETRARSRREKTV